MDKLRVAIYCRVACKDKFSLEQRAAKLQQYAKKAGYTIIGVMAEYGSGATLDRPALAEVTKAIYAGKVDMVLVKDISRIGRGFGVTQSYIDILVENKVSLLCVTDELKITNRNLYSF